MQSSISHLLAAVLAAPLLFVASTANAAPDRASCGNIELIAGGSCEMKFEGGCTAACQPISFVAACEGQCSLDINASCTATCSATCEAKCDVDPGKFDCQGSCEVDCGGSCEARCAAQANKADCTAYCKGSCKTDCDARCTADLPEADCKAQCKGSCSGSCQAQANFDCSYKCSAELKGGCEVDCKAPEGALFCDGQYVNVTNLDDCVEYLRSQLNFEVDYEAKGHCDINGCEGDASASIGCTAAPVGSAPFDVGAIATVAVGIGFVASRRRRRA